MPSHRWQEPPVQASATSWVQPYCMASTFILVKRQLYCVFNYGNQESLCWLTTKSLSSREKTTRSLNFHYCISGTSLIYFISNKLCLSVVSFRKFQMRLKIMHPIISHPSMFQRLRQTDFRVKFALSWLMSLIKRLYCDINSLKNVLESQYWCLMASHKQGPCLKQH